MGGSPALAAVETWLEAFAGALARGDARAAGALFAGEGLWRDLVAFTWNLKTVEGPPGVEAMLAATISRARPHGWRVLGEPTRADGVAEAWIAFETAAGLGRGHVRIADGRCRTLLTALRALRGFEEPAGRRREQGVEHRVVRGRPSWLERREAETRELGRERQPYCLIIGGGQGGIALAARLRRLGVPTVVVERNARAGDSWRRRYRSLCLHDPVWYDHMPYLPFPDHWPVFSPKDKLADWLEMYVRVMELSYWTSTECLGARYDEDAGAWEVRVARSGEELVLRPRQLVLATGMSGMPKMPELEGADDFEGTLRHSSAHPGGRGQAGQRCVVIGSNNSAHDIAAELWECGASVTMVQRSPTIVVRSESLAELAWGPLYSEDALERGVTTDVADLTVASVPFKLMPARQVPIYEEIRRRDADLYESLDRVGFMYHFGVDGSGIHSAYMRRGSGYYIDVGASRLVADGDIGLASGTTVSRLGRRSVVLGDGRELPADLVVCATGYGPMTEWAEQLVSPEVADRVGKVWGLGSDTPYDPGPWEGELRNMWKPTHQPALWFHGGNLMQSRHYSLYLALQLKARMEGLATPVYGLEPVHHRR